MGHLVPGRVVQPGGSSAALPPPDELHIRAEHHVPAAVVVGARGSRVLVPLPPAMFELDPRAVPLGAERDLDLRLGSLGVHVPEQQQPPWGYQLLYAPKVETETLVSPTQQPLES